MSAVQRVEDLMTLHWLLFDGDRLITGCHCGFRADVEQEGGWGDSVVEHLMVASIQAVSS